MHVLRMCEPNHRVHVDCAFLYRTESDISPEPRAVGEVGFSGCLFGFEPVLEIDHSFARLVARGHSRLTLALDFRLTRTRPLTSLDGSAFAASRWPKGKGWRRCVIVSAHSEAHTSHLSRLGNRTGRLVVGILLSVEHYTKYIESQATDPSYKVVMELRSSSTRAQLFRLLAPAFSAVAVKPIRDFICTWHCDMTIMLPHTLAL